MQTAQPIIRWILIPRNYYYVVEKIKGPMMASFVKINTLLSGNKNTFLLVISIFLEALKIARLIKRYPRPTMTNCIFPNTRRVLAAEEKFLKYQYSKREHPLFECLFDLLAIEIEHDGDMRYRWGWLIKFLKDEGWEDNPEGFPTWTDHHWLEPGAKGLRESPKYEHIKVEE